MAIDERDWGNQVPGHVDFFDLHHGNKEKEIVDFQSRVKSSVSTLRSRIKTAVSAIGAIRSAGDNCAGALDYAMNLGEIVAWDASVALEIGQVLDMLAATMRAVSDIDRDWARESPQLGSLYKRLGVVVQLIEGVAGGAYLVDLAAVASISGALAARSESSFRQSVEKFLDAERTSLETVSTMLWVAAVLRAAAQILTALGSALSVMSNAAGEIRRAREYFTMRHPRLAPESATVAPLPRQQSPEAQPTTPTRPAGTGPRGGQGSTPVTPPGVAPAQQPTAPGGAKSPVTATPPKTPDGAPTTSAVPPPAAGGPAPQAAVGNMQGNRSAFRERYLNETGGRWGGRTTRELNDRIATNLERQVPGTDVRGDARTSEEWIPGPGGGREGGTFVDITAKTPDGRTIRVQTVDTLADGVTPTPREAAAAARIRAQFPGDELRLVPKPK